jgi:hypothetical protein
MMYRSARVLAVGLTALTTCCLSAQVPVEGPASTTAMVYADSRSGAHLDPASLQVQVNGHPVQVSGVEPVSSGQAEVAILIDSSLRSSFDLQLQEIQKFVGNLPPNTKLLVGYMENGTVRSSGHFTADREQLQSSLHITMSMPGLSASPYFCLSDFVKHWPSDDHAARFVLMITNGVDPYNGSTSLMNQDSPYVESAQEDAVRAGVAVYSIYFPDAGFRGGRGSLSGQSYLQQVGEATGGMTFNVGSIPPVSIAPYLDQFRHAIAESYKVTFMTSVAHMKRGELERLKVKTSQAGMKLYAPNEVHPGAAE